MFFRSHNPDLYAWHAIISAHIMHGDDHGALMLCGWMLDLEIEPDRVMLMTMMKACGNIGCIDMGRIVHNIIIRREIESKNTIGSCLIDMYGKCGSLAEAQRVADMLPIVKNVVIWGSLIASYVNVGLGKIALNQFEEMTSVGTCPDKFILSSVAKACGIMESSWKGKMVHFHVIESRLESDVIVGTSLIDMYGKCKSMQDACYVFNNLLNKNVTSWNALIAGYARQGESELTFALFERMRKVVKPDEVTFLTILTLCTHAGLVEKGLEYFKDMIIEHRISPNTKHRNCIVDLLSRAGQLDEAVLMMRETPFRSDLAMWSIVLAACKKWGNVELGKYAFECVMDLDENHATAFVMLSNIYADVEPMEDGK